MQIQNLFRAYIYLEDAMQRLERFMKPLLLTETPLINQKVMLTLGAQSVFSINNRINLWMHCKRIFVQYNLIKNILQRGQILAFYMNLAISLKIL